MKKMYFVSAVALMALASCGGNKATETEAPEAEEIEVIEETIEPDTIPAIVEETPAVEEPVAAPAAVKTSTPAPSKTTAKAETVVDESKKAVEEAAAALDQKTANALDAAVTATKAAAEQGVDDAAAKAKSMKDKLKK